MVEGTPVQVQRRYKETVLEEGPSGFSRTATLTGEEQPGAEWGHGICAAPVRARADMQWDGVEH